MNKNNVFALMLCLWGVNAYSDIREKLDPTMEKKPKEYVNLKQIIKYWKKAVKKDPSNAEARNKFFIKMEGFKTVNTKKVDDLIDPRDARIAKLLEENNKLKSGRDDWKVPRNSASIGGSFAFVLGVAGWVASLVIKSRRGV